MSDKVKVKIAFDLERYEMLRLSLKQNRWSVEKLINKEIGDYYKLYDRFTNRSPEKLRRDLNRGRGRYIRNLREGKSRADLALLDGRKGEG
ncbi:MAG: hypothetical protein LBT22_09310 [Peptococcaceae bacterium]|jgi:hypothetical protein|nr:hypothetical protein [Peptococcaceae bacterium]